MSTTRRLFALVAFAIFLGGCRARPVDSKTPFAPWLSITGSEGEQVVTLFVERESNEPLLQFRCSNAVVEFRDDGLVAVRLEGVRGAVGGSGTVEQEQVTWLDRPDSEQLSIVLGTGVLEISDQAGHTAEFMDAETWGVLTADSSR